ncbi:unnamed protein product [Prunus armeniaca]
MARLKFPIIPFRLCSQSNPTPKTFSLTPLMFFKFDFTSSFTEVAAITQLFFGKGCDSGCGYDGTSSGGGGKFI